MDTPEKTQITTSLSKFEDSPVFNYINSLSPIKPVKSVHITQTFQSLSFSSLPSIFTSPHVSSHKESRFFKRHNNTDPSKPEFSSENASKTGTDEGSSVDVAQLYDGSSQLQENFDPGVSIAVELPAKLNYDAGSPETEAVPRSCPETFAFELSEKCLPEDETRLNQMRQTEQENEDMECDWENLISDSADLLIFNSPIDTESFKGLMHKPVCSHASFSTSSEQLDTENPSTQPRETIDPKDKNQTWDYRVVANNNDEEIVEVQLQAVSNLHRGMLRRCLDFEMVEASRKSLVDNSISRTLAGRQSNESIACKDEQLAPVKPDSVSSRRVLPGIGLHLNALALTCKDTKSVMLENLSRGISLVSSVSSLQSPTTRKDFSDSLALASEDDPTENGGLLAEDAPQTSACVVTEELIQYSPKKKRRKSEGEGEACKRCNCKKSKCLKLYCECFAAGVYCIEPCSCQECFNKPIHEDTVLSTRKQIESRNPLAFAPKVIRNSEPVAEIGDESTKTPASARHKRGCNCKKSSCLKKYCECYQGGVGCSINCRCEGCKNAYGRKDGSLSTEIEAEPEEETEGDENNGIDKVTEDIEMENNEEQTSSPALIMTPLPLCRPLLQLPFSSKTKPPSSFLGIGSSSGLYIGQKYGKPSILRPQQKQLQTVPDDDIPEILRGNCTPTTGIKTSPNGKRVSPPQSILGSSTSLKSGRKLILQSIPSFPSLTQH